MKAIIFEDVEKVRCETVPDPRIEDPRDAIVRITHAGLCGSDLHVFHGRERGLDVGTVLGHELAGEIVEIGNDVRHLKKGERVSCPFTINCGNCFFCHKGLTARCTQSQLLGWVENGNGLHGGQAEFARIPLADSTLLKLPEGVSEEEGLLLGDNFTTGYFCAEMAEIEPEGTYLVLGCGTVGLMTICAARQLGANKLFAFDPVPYRTMLASALGTKAFSNVEEMEQAVFDATDGRGADSVMEVVGNTKAQALAIKMLRFGGILSVAGVHTEPQFAFSPVDAFDQNLIYKTGRCSSRAKMPELIPMVQQKQIDLSELFITHRMPLTEGVRAYELFSQRLDNCIKMIFTTEE